MPIGMLNLSQRLIDPHSPDRRPRRAAYALPTLFTAGNVFLGFAAIMKAFQGSMYAFSGSMGPNPDFETAAKMIGAAVFLDGLDGRIARMTNTVSDFGREIDSLADVITFGIAPAVLAFAWGVHFSVQSVPANLIEHFRGAGYFIPFLYLLCGAARLARFNVQKNPVPKNPGRADRKYFVGLPIPAAAALIAALVYAADGIPVQSWFATVAWLGLLGLLSFLMVSTWRYRSFKDLQLLRPRSPLMIVVVGSLIYLTWNYSEPVLLAVAIFYVSSGIAVRIGGLLRRRFRPSPPAHPEHQIG
jgi:CDP-diacylglycerol---serine O-phosphatidyltransferase